MILILNIPTTADYEHFSISQVWLLLAVQRYIFYILLKKLNSRYTYNNINITIKKMVYVKPNNSHCETFADSFFYHQLLNKADQCGLPTARALITTMT